MRVHGLVAELTDFLIGVFPLKGGQVDHIQNHVQCLSLRRLLDASLGETGSPLLDAGLVDRGGPSEIRWYYSG
jgi:hypothetical protein